ncbi:MAG: CPBP family intramembrane metalloprotease [gamma proteobacterium symbiont of Phacoides pectinatus]
MRALALFVGLVLLALLLSALVNYPLHLLLQGNGGGAPHSLINTTGKLILLPCFVLLLRHHGLANRRDLGYALGWRAFLVELLKGLGMGLTILLVLAAVLLALEIRVPRPFADGLPALLAKTLAVALIGGVLIGFIEETFFRGGLFAAVRRQSGPGATLVLTSLFYAWMHFIDPQPLPPGQAIGWDSGLRILAGTFDGYTDSATIGPFLALFLLGLYLGLIRERTGNIAYAIGLHAGVVVVIKTLRKLTTVDTDNDLAHLVSHYDGTIGYLSAAGLSLHLILVFRHWRRPRA